LLPLSSRDTLPEAVSTDAADVRLTSSSESWVNYDYLVEMRLRNELARRLAVSLSGAIAKAFS
jgi:hypothetical protein